MTSPVPKAIMQRKVISLYIEFSPYQLLVFRRHKTYRDSEVIKLISANILTI